MRRRLRIVWLVVLVAISAYFSVIEHALLWPRAADRATSVSIEIMHWNMMQPDLSDPQRFREVVLADDADVLILTDAWAVRSDRDVRREVESQGRTIATHGPFTIITRREIQQIHWRMAREQAFAVRLTIEADDMLGRPLHILMIDLPSDPRLSRAQLAADVRAALDARPDVEPDMIIGDFNTTRGGFALRQMFPGMNHAFDEAGYGYAATYPRPWPLYHIDHILLGEAVSCLRYDMSDPGMSRHRIQRAWIGSRSERP